MSLKFEPEIRSKEIVDAVEDYINGERNSEKKLRKFVNHGMSEYDCNKLIEKYAVLHRYNEWKKERERTRKRKRMFYDVASFIFWLVSMSCTLVYLVERYGKGSAVWFLFFGIWAISHISNDPEKIDLKQENTQLKEDLTFYKNINKELEEKLEKVQHTSHQD